MSIAYRYIYKRLLLRIVSVTIIMNFLIAIFIFLGELDAIRNDYQLINAVWYTITSMPSITIDILPFICLISVLTVIGSMTEDNELTILRISGVSTFRLSVKVLMLVFVVVCAFVVADNFVFGTLNIYKEEYKIMRKYPNQKSGIFNLWIREKNAFILLTSIKPKNSIGESHIFQFDDNYQVRAIETSASGTINEHTLNFEDVNSTSIEDTSEVRIQSHTVIGRDTSYNINYSKLESIEPGLLSLTDLYAIARFQVTQNGGSNAYWATFLSKLLLPINICALVFLSLTFVFGSTRSISAGSRVFIGIVVGLVFYFISRLSVPVHLATGLPAVISILFPGALAVILGITLTGYINKR